MQNQAPAPPARVGIAEAMQHDRYGIDADSSSAPQPDPRARQKVPPRAKALEKNWPSVVQPAAVVVRPVAQPAAVVWCGMRHRTWASGENLRSQ